MSNIRKEMKQAAKDWEQAVRGALTRAEEPQRKYEALVKRLDNLCDEWELIEAPLCIKAYQRCIRELRALLEDEDG